MGSFGIDILQFIIINGYFILSTYLITRNISNGVVKGLSILSFVLFHFYNGLGLANVKEIDYLITLKYFIFLSFYQTVFLLTYKKYINISFKIQKLNLSFFENKKYSLYVIVIYNILYLMPFVSGNVSFVKLVLPDASSLLYVGDRVEDVMGLGLISTMVNFFKVLLLPIYFVYLYNYRNRKGLLFVLILLPLYLKFAALGYSGRSRPLAYILIYILFLYIYYPKYRKTIIISVIAFIPIAVMLLNYYTYFRKGMDYKLSAEIFEQGNELYFAETSLPDNGYNLYRFNEEANLGEYLKWALTLPIPTVIKGDVISGIGYEMSEKIRLQSRFDSKYSVDLVGGFFESFYIYGKTFYFIHAITMGFLMGLLFRIFSSRKRFLLLFIFVAFQFGYFFGRAGISSVLPTLINKLLLIYLILIFAKKSITKYSYYK